MTVLPDTSVWVQFFRKGRNGPARELAGFLEQRDVLACGPVVAELLVGTNQEDRGAVWDAVGALPWAELDRIAWRQAGEVGYALRRQGIAVPLTDIVIAVASVRAGALLWTADRDFERIQRVFVELDLRML